MKRSTWIAAVVMTLAIAGAIAWAGIEGDRTRAEERAEARRGDDVEAGQRVSGETAPAPRPSVADDPARVAAAVASAREVADEEVARRLGSLDDEPRDDAWADEEEASLRAWGEGIATELEARVTEVRCRTERCVMQLVWPDYATAQHEARTVLAGEYGEGCEREIRTPMPQDPRLPYAGFVLLTCSRE